MTELEHLTKLIETAMYWGADTPEKIAERLIDEGVIITPCKVGDTVYRIIEMGTGIHYRQVGRYEVGCSSGYKVVPCEETIKRFIRSVRVTKNNFFDIRENFGKTVYLTREEAEAALAERRRTQ